MRLMHVPPYFLYLTRINQKGAESLFPRRGCKKPKHLMHKLTQHNQCKIPVNIKFLKKLFLMKDRYCGSFPQEQVFPKYGLHKLVFER